MDFGALPPEVNSGRMYLGPGPATLLAASAGWDSLAVELNTAASGYQSVITTLTDESWMGPTSMSMAAAVSALRGVDDGPPLPNASSRPSRPPPPRPPTKRRTR